MGRWYLYSSLLLLVLLLAACGLNVINGSGRVVSEARSVRNFDAVSLSGSGELTITQGDGEALTVEAEDNILPLIRTEVRNETLTLGFDRKHWFQLIRPTQPIRFKLAVKNLKHIALSGSGSIEAATLQADQLAATISGSGDLKLDRLTASDLSFNISGSGRANLAGQVTGQTIVISGNGDYQAGDLASQTSKITVSGSGQATLWARETLDVNISGSGTVNYSGAAKVNTQISGSGRVNRLGDK